MNTPAVDGAFVERDCCFKTIDLDLKAVDVWLAGFGAVFPTLSFAF